MNEKESPIKRHQIMINKTPHRNESSTDIENHLSHTAHQKLLPNNKLVKDDKIKNY